VLFSSSFNGVSSEPLRRKIAFRLDCTTADVEGTHAYHKHQCRGKSTVSIEAMGATSCLKEALDHYLSSMSEHHTKQTEKTNICEKETKRASPLQLLHYVRMKAAGGRWFVKQAWANSLEAWNKKISRASQLAYENLSLLPQSIAHAALWPSAMENGGELSQSCPAPAPCKNASTLPGVPFAERVEDGSKTLPLTISAWQEALSTTPAKERAKLWDEKFVVPPVTEERSRGKARACHKCCCKADWDTLHSQCQWCFNALAKKMQSSEHSTFARRFPIVAIHQAGDSCLEQYEHSLFYLMVHASKSPMFQIFMVMTPTVCAEGKLILKPCLHEWHNVDSKAVGRFPPDNHGRCKLLHSYEVLHEVARLGNELLVSVLEYKVSPKPPWLRLFDVKIVEISELSNTEKYDESISDDDDVDALDGSTMNVFCRNFL